MNANNYFNKLTSIIFLFMITLSYSQNTMTGSVLKIKDGNSFVFISENKLRYIVQLKDTKVKSTKAKDYLSKTILGKNVVLSDVEIEKKSIKAVVIYNCKFISENNDDIPCSEGNILNIEMLKFDFLDYTGEDNYLKKL